MPAAAPKVSVVVSTRNRAELLEELLDGLRTQTLGADRFELVVVDDASSDRTATLLETERARGELDLQVLRRDHTGGPALGREQGWRRARASLIAFTDDDCVPAPQWLERCLSASERHPGAVIQGVTAPRSDQLHRRGPFLRTVKVSELNTDFPTPNIAYPRPLLEALDGFDTVIYANAVGGEDTDLGWRALAHGAEVIFAPDAVVEHAVHVLGPYGKLRLAARQSAVLPFARHPGSRRQVFIHGIFRRRSHFYLVLAALGLALPGRWRAFGLPLTTPYLYNVYARGRTDGTAPYLTPYYLAYDLVETYATVRGGIRAGKLMI